MPDETNQNQNNKPATTPAVDEAANLEEKKEIARQAMEGAEWTAKRENEEKTKKTQAAMADLTKRLAEIHTEKEKLELEWISLDDTRRKIRKVLEPILVEEKKIEEEEANLELEEEKAAIPAEKQVVEKKRWAVQDKRKELEQKKWGDEDKMTKIEKTINENTTRYRQLLDEEDKLQTQIDQLNVSGV